MKKMQCEVCGSTDIKKIDDTTFECQSCGVQYSKEEVQKLLVEIPDMAGTDVSQELENTNQPTSDAIYTDMDYGVTGDDINISSSSKTGAMRILNVSRHDNRQTGKRRRQNQSNRQIQRGYRIWIS